MFIQTIFLVHHSTMLNLHLKILRMIKYRQLTKTKSISSILKNALIEQDYLDINQQLNDDLINTFIKNIIINDEKIINNKYISKIRVNFDKKKL